MTPVQIQAAKILLSKVAPDLTAVSGEIIHNHRSEMVREIVIQPIANSSSGPELIEGKAEYVELEPIRELLNQDEHAREMISRSDE